MPVMPNPMTASLLRTILMMLLIWQLSVPSLARAQAQISSAHSPKQILLLYSYGDGMMAYQQATRAFLSIMEESGVSESTCSSNISTWSARRIRSITRI